MGVRGRAGRVGRGTRALGNHVHGIWPGRACCVSRYDRGLRHRRASWRDQAPRGQECRPPAAPDRRALGAPPSSQDRVRRRARRDRAFPLGRPRKLERPRTGASTSRRRLVGLVTDRHRSPAAPHRARLAAPLPRRQGHRGRRAVSRGPGTARPRRTDPRPSTPTHLDLRPSRRLRTDGRRSERGLPLRTSPRRGQRRDPPLLRCRRQLHLPRHRTTGRPARRCPRRATRDGGECTQSVIPGRDCSRYRR